MDMITAPVLKTLMLRKNELKFINSITEIGIFSLFIGDSKTGQIYFNEVDGLLPRTKQADCDEGGVNVVEVDGFFVQHGSDTAEDFEAADAANAGVGIGKEVTDVGFAGGAEEGIGDRVAEDIGVGVAVETERVGDHHAAEDEGAVHDEAVDIVAYAGGDHSRPRSNFPLEATMEYFSGREAWGCMFTRPPAVSTRRIPAATSQRLIMLSM